MRAFPIHTSFAIEIYGSRRWTAELVTAARTVDHLISAFLPRRRENLVVFHLRLPPPAHRLCTCKTSTSVAMFRGTGLRRPYRDRDRQIAARRSVLAFDLLSKSSVSSRQNAVVGKCGT